MHLLQLPATLICVGMVASEVSEKICGKNALTIIPGWLDGSD